MKRNLSGNEVRYILRSERINLRQLADKLGISPQTLNSRLNAGEVKTSFLEDINHALGQELFHSDMPVPQWTGRQPIIDIRIGDSLGLAIEAAENKVVEYVNIPMLTGCIGVSMYGDAMRPRYNAGDIIFVRPIPLNAIEYGRAYIIVTSSDRIIRNVIQGDNERLHLTAEDATLPPYDIDRESVLYLYKVVGCLHREQM